MFLPMFSFPASQGLAAVTAYELAAMILGWQPWLGHMAHFSGIVAGLVMMRYLYERMVTAKRKQQNKRL